MYIIRLEKIRLHLTNSNQLQYIIINISGYIICHQGAFNVYYKSVEPLILT